MSNSALSTFDLGARAMTAQLTRLNTIASNVANSSVMAGSPDTAYRALKPVFETTYTDATESEGLATVDVVDIQRSTREVPRVLQPGNPLADREGYVYLSNVDVSEELVDMVETSRQYQNTIEALNTTKSLMVATLRLAS